MNSQQYQEIVPTFHKYQVWVFKYIGLWKLSAKATKWFRLMHTIYFWHIALFWVLLFDSTQLIQFIANIAYIDEVIKVFFMFATLIAVKGKLAAIKTKSKQFQELIDNMHQQPMFRPENDSEVQLFMQSVQLSRRLRNSYGVISLCALNAVLVPEYFAGNTQLPMSAYTPFSLEQKWRYNLMYLYQCFSITLCCFMNIAFDSISASLLVFAMGQLDILNDRIRHLDVRSQGDNNETIYLKLQRCVLNHGEILKLSNMIEDILKFPVSMQIFCSILVLIANFYAMSLLTGDYYGFLMFLIYQICMLSQIFMICFYANEVTLKSSQLSYALYTTNWITWNKSNRKLLLLMMLQFDTPIRIKGVVKNYSFNLASFTSIVNSSYSYFALLKNINS